MPLISVIVPIYKVKEEYLRQCIESLTKQTYTNIEIILVNDGTPDNGGAICDEYAKQDNRIKVIHQENQGVSAARNNGINKASGDWITFVDADDWIELNAFKKIKNIILEEEMDFLIFAMKINFTNQEIINPFWNKDFALLDKYDREELQIQILHPRSSKYVPPIAMVGVAVCKLYKKSFLEKYNIYFDTSLTYSEDRVFAFYALEYASKVGYINEYLYNYRNHSESITQRYREVAQIENNKALNVLQACITKFGKKEIFHQAFYYRVILSIFILCDQYYCHKQNHKSITKKVKEIESLCRIEMYKIAIENTSIIQYSKVSTKPQTIGFTLLKNKMYILFYYFIKIKNKIKSIK